MSLKTAAAGWLLFVVAVTVLALRQGPSFDSSIMSLLPESTQQPLVQRAADLMAERFSKRLILLLSGVEELRLRGAVTRLSGSLAALPDVSRVIWRLEESEVEQYRTELYSYRYAVIDEGIRALLLAGDFQQVQQRALFQLYSPLSVGGGSIVEDPFGLFTELTLNRRSEFNVQVSDSLLKVSGTEQPTYMLMVELAADPFSPALQKRVLGAVEAEQAVLTDVGIKVDMSGMLLHAAAGAQQASGEISTIGLGSLLGIVVVMWLTFRQLSSLLLMLVPVVVGSITAAAITLLVFERVHLVTFAFGAGLVGVSIDYALHYLCEHRRSSSDGILVKIMPGLLLGLFSSVMAYAALALAPFPGLRQMATFSVVGLSAAWLTVVLWLPLLARGGPQQPLALAAHLDRLRAGFPFAEGNPLLVGGLLVSLLFSVYTLWSSKSLDDIRLLQTSPVDLLKQEQSVQRALGVSSSSQFFLIRGDSLEQCLQREERLTARLEGLKAAGMLEGYQALSQVLPSLRRQAENSALVQQLYEQQLPPYLAMLNVSDHLLSDAYLSLARTEGRRLTPEIWLQQRGSDSWKDLIVEQSEWSAATLVRLTGTIGPETRQHLIALSDSDSAAVYIDQVQNISELMGSYRGQIVNWVVVAYLCVMLVLGVRYKKQIWRILLPPLLASVVTLALLVTLEQGVNLFHLMALILVLGIGLDMGIFLMETRQAPYTWLAVSLSSYTSLLAFGLLALSDTPVLHHFGLTVLIGLTLVWLLTPIMRNKTKEKTLHG
ncbi:MMPL family transporter [Marinobacterium arenosum]|uniref:MMPL family transporter n=1 Tax=Marinobacterium arenosum TaxID=2862496 RepID=UPI001C9420B3|nr:hypothetical protein [Marinobacterium arenosum]